MISTLLVMDQSIHLCDDLSSIIREACLGAYETSEISSQNFLTERDKIGSGGGCLPLSIIRWDTFKSSYKAIFSFLHRHPKRPCQMVSSQAALLNSCVSFF